jgi:hypothetical protein
VAEYGLKEGYHAFITGKKTRKEPIENRGTKKGSKNNIFIFTCTDQKKVLPLHA